MITALFRGAALLLLSFNIVFFVTSGGAFAQEGTSKDYIIGPEDVLDIQVWGNDDLHRSVEVSQEGDFTFPLINNIRAAGLSVFDLERTLKKQLADGYLVDPHVTVTVSTYKSQKVYLLGEMKKTGTYVIKGRTPILKVISEAGGLTDDASRVVTITRAKMSRKRADPNTRNAANEDVKITVDLDLIREGSSEESCSVYDGDSVSAVKAAPVYVGGEVNRPGAYKWEKGMSVPDALSLAGGLTKEAGTTITISRRKASSPGSGAPAAKREPDATTITLDLDSLQKGGSDESAMVLSGDAVSVSKAPLVYITGEVNRPGAYKWEKGLSVFEAISEAGGATKEAGTTITITRPREPRAEGDPKATKGASDATIIVVELDPGAGATGEVPFLAGGDSLSVSKAPPIYVTGEVNRPGEFKWDRRMTVRQAVSLAGGPTGKGALERTRIIRTRNGQEKEMRPDLNDTVQAYDIIRVPQSFF